MVTVGLKTKWVLATILIFLPRCIEYVGLDCNGFRSLKYGNFVCQLLQKVIFVSSSTRCVSAVAGILFV